MSEVAEVHLRVLLVNPDLNTRYCLAAHLHQHQCSVDQTDMGRHAWEMLRCCHYDAVVMELRLLDISGLELLRLMRSLDDMPPVIVGMSDVMPAIRRIAMSMGAAGCYVKPMSPEAIFELMMAAVECRGQADQWSEDCAA